MKSNILVLSKGWIHPSIACRLRLRAALLAMTDEFSFTFASSFRSLAKINQDNERYDAILLFYHEQKIDQSIIESISRFCESGGGLFLIHGAMASFKKIPAYRKLVGGIFTGHGPVDSITLHNDTMSFTVVDELYVHEYDKNNRIWLYGTQNEITEPVIWSKDHHSGRIAYLSVGHRSQTFQNLHIQTIIQNILRYVCKRSEVIV